MSFDGDLYPEAGASKVITSKGDLVRGDASGDRERYGIGSTGQILTVASSLPTWSTLTTADSVLTTQGDVLIEGAAGLERLGQSTDGYVLTTKGAGANPIWATVSASPTLTRTKVNSTTAQSTSSASLVDLTGFTRTVANVTGKCICSYQTLVESNENYYTAWNFDGSAEPELKAKGSGTFYEPITTMGMTNQLSAIVCKMQYRVHDAAGTATAQVDSSNGTAYWMEIS